GPPALTVVGPTVRPTAVGIVCTTWVNRADEARNPVTGVYSAVIGCDPMPSDEMLSTACCWPEAVVRGTVARAAPPSLNVTDPCGVAPVAPTVAVIVTVWSKNGGDALLWRFIVVPTCTVWLTGTDADGLNPLAPA